MKYIIRKFVEAGTVQEAIEADRKTPVHDCYLKEGEEPKDAQRTSVVGFYPTESSEVTYEMRRKR